MSGETTTDSDRAVVTTYVPAYQKEAWAEHADDLGMSQSEFVRTMVQAGRHGFGGIDGEPTDPGKPSSDREPQGSGPENGLPTDVESAVLRAIESEPYLEWDGIVRAVVGDVESEIEAAIESLDDRGEISYKPREGGYVRVEE